MYSAKPPKCTIIPFEKLTRMRFKVPKNSCQCSCIGELMRVAACLFNVANYGYLDKTNSTVIFIRIWN